MSSGNIELSYLAIAGLGSPASVAISRNRHTHWRWRQSASFSFAEQFDATVIVVSEVEAAASALPLAFVMTDDGPEIVAVLRMPGSPHIVDGDGNWMTSYVPALLRAWPFCLAMLPDKSTELHVVEPTPLLSQELQGARFFEDDGRPSPEFAPVVQFFQNWDSARRATRKATQALADLNLLQPAGEAWGGAGLFHIESRRLETLGDAEFLSLRRNGALLVAQAQILSLHHFRPVKRQARRPGRDFSANPDHGALSSFLDALAEEKECIHPPGPTAF